MVLTMDRRADQHRAIAGATDSAQLALQFTSGVSLICRSSASGRRRIAASAKFSSKASRKLRPLTVVHQTMTETVLVEVCVDSVASALRQSAAELNGLSFAAICWKEALLPVSGC